jgi:hypothetical protein
MPDETPQRRVLPARERRESAAKRRAQSPEPAPTPAKKSATPASDARPKRKYTKRASLIPLSTPSGTSTPPVEDVIPTKLTSSKPLPSTRQKQASNLSTKDYQSIADSAILAASLHRSRAQWLVDGVFKKYWTKPVKRKGVIDVPSNNPEQKSMQRLGNGTITIEPHKFDVSFYTVREAQAPFPYYRHPNQHTPKATSLPPANNGPDTPSVASPATSTHGPQQTPVTQSHTNVVKQEVKPATPNPAAGNLSSPPKPASKPTSDPVIQMLAARAASDPHLKELMKVVATSKASAEQLKEFQGHIDEFNAVVKRQDAERAAKEKEERKNVTGLVSQTDRPPSGTPTPGASHPSTYSPAPAKSGPSGSAPPLYANYPPAPRPEPIIKHIVVEFHGEGASQDRWLFPEYAVLDIKYGDVEMICSFFVERKGSEILASLAGESAEEMTALRSKWKADQEYYQPITMLVRANQHRTIETIARAAKVLPQVQAHMKAVMKDKVRAPEEYLVHQLPREKGLATGEIPSVDFVDSAVEMLSDEEDDELKEFYGN